jgi:amino acid adenylation domain-containing protein
MTITGAVAPLLEPILAGGAGAQHAALRMRDNSVTYAELRQDVLVIRDWLARNCVSATDRVVVCLPKAIETVEIILGVLAAGAAYVPLNHRLPIAQLRRTIDDLQPALVIATPDLARSLRGQGDEREGVRMAVAEGSGRGRALEPAGTVAGVTSRRLTASDHLAALLYTSGSTGEPKGIMLTEKNITSFVEWAANTFEISSTDRVVSHAPLHFDLSIFDIFCTLTRHGSLHLIDETTARFAGAVRALVQAGEISVWYSVPTALMQLQERRAFKDIGSLRLVLFAGEVFPVPVLRRMMDDLPAADFANLYGPTETNVCTYHRLPGAPASDLDPLPIGRPCEHLRVDVFDPAGHPVPAGETGEICVAGPSVMRGYWQQDELTRATRLPNRPDSYCTGDYGYTQPDGLLMFVGRRDHQVKVRGHRVELLALEATLNAHPQVQESAALLVPDGRDGGILVAFVVPRDEAVASADICRFIEARLAPSYQPHRIEWLPEMPRTANGKADRTVLLARARSMNA